jgi:hemoglobin
VSATRESLFDRIGGEAAVEAAVVSFYDKVMADEALARFFGHLDMGAQVRKQIAFMTMAFGGPNAYTGRDLRTAHRALLGQGLADTHFDAVVEHLRTTLVELGVDATTTLEVLGVVESTRADVLGR